ncbi:MAG: aminopeptidase P family protein [Candidatus Thermoplasmatota archaeon]|nr:aminopeptidase P family protein [Candidatus Thermoplasmatota archaeon]MCL5438047.1 aminopeptidase P family protein [Candidatus Thermoplasmatota archaeon]
MDYDHIFDYAREVDTILILNGGENEIDKSFFYLSEASSGIFEGSALIVKPDSLKMITTQLEEESARSTGLEVRTFNGRTDFTSILREELKDVDTIGLNYSSLTLRQYLELLKLIPDKRFVDVSGSIQESRRFKQPEEIKRLREATKITSEAFDAILPHIKEGIRETELASELVYQMMKLGAKGPSFDSIIAFGANSSMPHYSPGPRKLKKNEFVLMDFGALYERYCADMTRTVVFGRASDEQKEMYQIVRDAQDAAMKVIRENVNGKDVDKAARDVIDSSRYKGRFIHSLGHGIGMEVHDHGALSPSYDFPLKENMTITNEPGVYVSKVGGVRIEDDVIVKKDGCEVITTASRDLIEV